MPGATLKANERIKKSQDISTLIRTGQAFFSAPYKIYFKWSDCANPGVRAAFAVPKRNFAKAVMRNRLKRLSRECFRLQKHDLVAYCQDNQKQLDIVFLYQKTKVEDYKALHVTIGRALDKIKENG